MILLIAGGTHTGKTYLAQRLLEKYRFPYLSVDHLKMGLIRSRNTDLTPLSDEAELTPYLWGIVREMIKTAVENGQNLIVEGCYIPFDWQKDFKNEYLEQIRYVCLVMAQSYIQENFETIKSCANVIERRLDDSVSMAEMIEENEKNLEMCRKYGQKYLFIEKSYSPEVMEKIFES